MGPLVALEQLGEAPAVEGPPTAPGHQRGPAVRLAKEAVEARSVQGQDPPEGDQGQAETPGALAIPEATVSHPERSLAGRKNPSSAVSFWKLWGAQSHMSSMLWSLQRKPAGSRGVRWGDKTEQREAPEKPPWKLWEARRGQPPFPRSRGPHGDTEGQRDRS